MNWNDVHGWLTPSEGEKLQELARGRKVLEIGTWKGRSACCMAVTAAQVTTVDTHAGDAEIGPADTFDLFEENVKACGAFSKIEPIKGDIKDVASYLLNRRFEMIFIDGSHDAESVQHDTQLAAQLLMPGGVIVWHDYDQGSVKDGIRATGLDLSVLHEHEKLAVLHTVKWQAVVTMPYSRMIEPEASRSFRHACSGKYVNQAAEIELQCGGLVLNFNMLLDIACNFRDKGNASHFAMIHSDISAEKGWVDILAEEMHIHNLVAISAVIPIKEKSNDRTSTAIGSKTELWEPIRYIHAKEQPTLPVTFTGADVCKNDDEVLLINTGLMLLDLRHPFFDNYEFNVYSRRRKDADGTRKSYFRSEDWEMSRDLERAGLRYGSTWRPYAEHLGMTGWPNRPRLQIISNSTAG